MGLIKSVTVFLIVFGFENKTKGSKLPWRMMFLEILSWIAGRWLYWSILIPLAPVFAMSGARAVLFLQKKRVGTLLLMCLMMGVMMVSR